MAQTGDDQINVVGHSQGTSVVRDYLTGSPQPAARVAKYIGIDGATGATCPGGVECMGLWARGSTARVLGPVNARLPDEGHTQSIGAAVTRVWARTVGLEQPSRPDPVAAGASTE